MLLTKQTADSITPKTVPFLIPRHRRRGSGMKLLITKVCTRKSKGQQPWAMGSVKDSSSKHTLSTRYFEVCDAAIQCMSEDVNRKRTLDLDLLHARKYKNEALFWVYSLIEFVYMYVQSALLMELINLQNISQKLWLSSWHCVSTKINFTAPHQSQLVTNKPQKWNWTAGANSNQFIALARLWTFLLWFPGKQKG